MEDQVVEQSGVDVPVAEEQVEQQEQEVSIEAGVEQSEVAAQDGSQQDNNFGPIITAEVQRREAQIQKRYEAQVNALERTARVYGFADVDSYLQALDNYEREQEIRTEAERLGVDESVIIEHLAPLKQKLNEYEQQMQSVREREAMLQVEQQLADLRAKHQDFDQYKDRAFDLAINSGYKLEDAYKLASYEDKLANISKQTEADTIRKLQDNASSTPGALGAEGAEHKTGFAAMSKDEQRKFIEDVKAGRRTSFD